MNRARYDDLLELAPDGAVDDTGLEVARAAFERGRRREQAGGMLTVGGSRPLVAPDSRRTWGVGRVLVLLTATVLVLGIGALGAVLVKDVALPADVGPQVVKPDSRTGPTVSPSPTTEDRTAEDAAAAQCDGPGSSLDGSPVIPPSEWSGVLDHGWMLPDVPVTAAPRLHSASVECAGRVAAVVFADAADGRAVAVYPGKMGVDVPVPRALLDQAEVETLPSGDHYVQWIDEFGDPWTAQAGGISAEEFRAILESLTYGPDGSATGPVPDGFEQVEVPEVEPGTTLYLWQMWHDDVNSYLSVTWPVTTPIEAGLADGRDYEAVEFDGGVALYSGGLPGVGANPPSLRWDRNGARFWLLDADADLDTLKARARSVRPLELDDPRLVPFLRR
ncbi:hypothetical protein [Promicromonospora sp. MEB111]|uniref:hypothetical protein n=1 Tax=Promicromonospora sp. MEB111 TaxID=3040301 RepID=UPI00254DB201|nr:hypothetical protein [Promicromonospora sp. MEB111]